MSNKTTPNPHINPRPLGTHADTRSQFANELMNPSKHTGTTLAINQMGELALHVTEGTRDRLYREHVEEPKLAEFLEHDPAGQQITSHKKLLDDLGSDIGSNILRHVQFEARERGPFTSFRHEYEAPVKKSGLAIDLAELDRSNEYSEYPEDVLHKVRKYKKALNEVSYRLADNDHLRIGEKVNVLRSPRPGETEPWVDPEWEIRSVLITGDIRVATTEANLADAGKPIPIDQLEYFNPRQ